MLEKILDEAAQAARKGDDERTEQLIRRLIEFPDEAMDFALKASRRGDKLRHMLIIHAIHLIGHPTNEPAIPELIYHIGDPNLPGWEEAIDTLDEMGLDIVIPHLIQALLEKGPPYHVEGNSPTWAYDVEGICETICREKLDREYAIRCCPAVNYLLSQPVQDKWPDPDTLLDVIERAGEQVPYVLPTLIMLARDYREGQKSYVGIQARKLIDAFPEEARNPYQFLLAQL